MLFRTIAGGRQMPSISPQPDAGPVPTARLKRAANGGDAATVPEEAAPLPASLIVGVPGTSRPPALAETMAAGEGAGRRRLRVSDIFVGSEDENGEKIDKVYASRESYAIYRADNEVRVQYADDSKLKDTQFQNVTAVSADHQELDYLTRGLEGRRYYLGQIAVALQIAVENGEVAQKLCSARAVLGRAISAAAEERARIGRRLYLRYATMFALGIAAVLLLCAVVALQLPYTAPVADLPAATGSGALGALFSIAIALRGRTVAPDHDVEANRSDALLRVMVGALSGGALILFLRSGILAMNLGDASVATGGLEETWRAILTFGFLAGFSERLVPDLLERKTPSGQSDAEAAGVATPG
jgi:hypothetical protein